MKQIRFRLLNWLVIAALILTIAPFAPSKADAAPTPSLYFQFRDFSIDSVFPTEVNSNIVDIAGTFSDVTASTISYRVEQITITGTGPTAIVNVVQSSVGTTSPVINGANYVFAGIVIYPGLNRLVVSGSNSSGNAVSGEAYINFGNVPAISEIKLTDARDVLNSANPLVTTNIREGLSIKAPNATGVFVNGKAMLGGANSSFVISDLGLVAGSNKLVIVAKNASKSYELTKYLVYFNNSMTVFDLKIGSTSIDGNPQINGTTSAPLTGFITGKLLLPAATVTIPSITLSIPQISPTPYTDASIAVTQDVPNSTSTYNLYTISSSTSPTINATGKYTVNVTQTNVSPNSTFPAKFSYRNTNAPFINDIKQAYGATPGTTANAGGKTDISYSSVGSFPIYSTVTQTPLVLLLDTTNFDASLSSDNTTVTATATDGSAVAGFTATTSYYTAANKPAVIIQNMPAGVMKLKITITNGTGSDTIDRTITYFPISSIQVDSIYEGKTFKTDFTSADLITGKIINFDLTNDAELDTLMLNFNGVDYPLLKAKDLTASPPVTKVNRLVDSTGAFRFDPTSPPVGGAANKLKLVLGPNTLIFKGIAGGIPVSTTITVYYFNSNAAAISPIKPVPFIISPALDPLPIKRVFNDFQAKFAPTGPKQYSTTDTKLDLLFDVKNVISMDVLQDGKLLAVVNVVTPPYTPPAAPPPDEMQITDKDPLDKISLCMEDDPSDTCMDHMVVKPAGENYTFRLSGDNGVPLPKSGSTNITVVVRAGSGQIIENVTILRDLSPYIILSPRLPEESVINSNFLMVSIKAEGASKVSIGKTDMAKGLGDIFRYEAKNLKPGVNTISFTVLQGTRKTNGKVSVNYAADNSLAAQYKSMIPKSGKLSMFKGELSVSFPKNTFLRQANLAPGQDVKTVDLFDSQELYFGLADRFDGRTVKKYNNVGALIGNEYQDGTIVDVPAQAAAASRLRTSANFNLSSNLFWLDAGYLTGGSLVKAMTPYATGSASPSDVFYLRARDPQYWLEPSQRGTITMQYDPNIRDALGQNLSVWRYIGDQWQNVGGVVNTKNKTVTAPLDGFGYYAVMSLRYSYSDVIGHNYARTAMDVMFSKGIMQSKEPNSFGAYDNITRGEFAQMLVKILDIPLEFDPNNMTFDDVLPLDYDGALWNYRFVETAVKKGFIRGKSPRLFFPNDTLTREEASIMIARAFNMVKPNADSDKDKLSLQKAFTDGGTVDIYAAASVQAIVKAKYLSGVPNTTPPKTFRFEPGSFLKRADAAVVAQKVMKALKKL